MSDAKLLPCPHCNGPAHLVIGDEFCRIRCHQCGATGGPADAIRESDAINAWNRRPTDTPASGEREGEGCSEGAFDNAYKDFMKRRIVDLTYLVGKHVDPNVVEPELEPLVLDCADEIDENAAKRALRKAEHVEDIPVEALFAMQEQALKRESAPVGFDETGMRGARPTPHPRQPVRMKILRLSFVWNYKGHNSGLFQRGPNWWQITLPPSRKMFRCALIAVKQ